MFLNETTDDVALTEEEEVVLTQIAAELGLVCTQEEADALNAVSDETVGALTEMKSIVRLNRDAKLTNFTVRSALVIARNRKDPDFIRYHKASMLRRQLRAKLVQKYQSQARTTARKILANTGKRNMVDVSATKAFGHPAS